MSSSDKNGGTPRPARSVATKKAETSGEESALVDVKEAARMCSISASMLYKLNVAGQMPAPIKLGTLLRWKRQDILGWIDKGCPTGKPKRLRK